MGGRPGYLWDADIERATRNWEMAPVVERHGQWAVTLYGVECVERGYFFPYDRVNELDWVEHMAKKAWCNMFDFVSALESARNKVKSGKARVRFLVLRRDGYRCQLCGAKASDGARLEVDHRHPRSKGGSDDLSNLWVLCWECNQGKSDLDL